MFIIDSNIIQEQSKSNLTSAEKLARQFGQEEVWKLKSIKKLAKDYQQKVNYPF